MAFRLLLQGALGVDAVSVDRLAVAIGIREGAAAGVEADLSPDVDAFADGPVFGPILAEGTVGSGSIGAFGAAGFGLLAKRYDALGGDGAALLASLLSGPGATSSASTGPEVTVPLGAVDGAPLTWTVNREAGRRTNANVRIAGVQGTGKTQFLQHLLSAIAARAPGTGLVLLDYKGDISGDAGFVKAVGARVVRPQREAVPINPFDVPREVRSGLLALEVAALLRSLATGMGAAQQEIVRLAVESAYTEAAGAAGAAPTAGDIARAVRQSYEDAGKAPDTVTAWLAQLAELGLFADRTAGSPAEFLGQRWIVDLSALGSLRTLVAFVLLHWVSRQVQACTDAPLAAGSLRQLQTIVAVDEAHHYLRARCEPLLTLLRIGRSKGVPVFLSSQSLADFREHTETDQLFAWTFLLGQGAKPDPKTLQAALGLNGPEAQRAADRAVQLEQFDALVPADENGPRPPMARLHMFFEGRWR